MKLEQTFKVEEHHIAEAKRRIAALGRHDLNADLLAQALAQAKAEGVRIGLEAAAKEGEAQQQSFLSSEYATGQPLSSLMERTAVKIYMQAILSLDTDTIIKEANDAG